MKKYRMIIICMSLLLPTLVFSQDFKPESVLPANLAKYKFGMSIDEFKKLNKTAVTSTGKAGNFTFRIEYEDLKAGNEYKAVTFYFDAENNKPLYEIIIEYKDPKVLKNFYTTKLKAPNDGKQWKWITKDEIAFKAWTFGQKLVFALALPATEMAE